MDDLSPARSPRRLIHRWLWPAVGVAFLTSLLGVLYYRRSRTRQGTEANQAVDQPDLGQFRGLSEEEVASRSRRDENQESKQKARQVRRDIWRTNTFSIFNLSMLGLAAAQALLGDPLGALLTIGVFILNVVLNAAQQLYATGRVERLLNLAQARATVIRGGQIKSIDVDDVVVDDLLVAGPGDEILADGELIDGRPQVVDTAAVRDQDRARFMGVGDPIKASTYCLQGRAIYRVTSLPGETKSGWTPVQRKTELTPLQDIIARVLRLLLAAISLFMIILFLDMINFPLLADLFEEDYRNVASVFFSIAPSGLYFMIVATYALGSARLGSMGALIRDSRAVESLAQVSTICFSKTGALSGAEVQIDLITPPDGQPVLAETRVRQILADFSHTIPGNNFFLQILSRSLPGSHRPLEQAAGHLSAHGWSALIFSDVDLRGTYIIGEPDLLPLRWENEAAQGSDTADQAGSSSFSGAITRLRDLFNRNDQDVVEERTASKSGVSLVETDRPPGQVVEAPAGENSNFFEGLRLRLGGKVRPEPDPEAQLELVQGPVRPQLLFAYSPEPQPLVAANGQLQLPGDLTPLCLLTFDERIRPEAREAVAAFTDSNVGVKILSAENPEQVMITAEQLGLIGDDPAAKRGLSGFELAQMEKQQFEKSIQGATVFGHLTPGQKGNIVRVLRQMDERVVMVGDSVDDVPAMKEANLSITLRNSSQAALNMADIVLLEDSLQVLPTVLRRGQKIVNGMLDILKLNLVQISYVLLLIIIMFLSGRRIFFYHSTQGGVIAFFTVIIPSVGLTLWASAGALPRQYMRSRLFHFVVPAAVTLTVATVLLGELTALSKFELADNWMTVTFGLVVMALLLVVFVQPPSRFWVGGDVLSGDWRNTYMAIGLFVLFLVATFLPLTQQLFRLSPLASPWLYLLIAALSLVWLFVLRAIWRAPWLSRYVGIISAQLERN